MPVAYPHTSHAARLARLKQALAEGQTFAAFARAEGITKQALQDWLDRRPDYAAQVARYRLDHRSAPVIGPRYWARVEAIRQRQQQGLPWKSVAYPLGITEKALKQWYYQHRETVDGLIAERRAA